MVSKTNQLPDKKLLNVVFALMALGWLMVLSASIHQGYGYAIKQALFIFIGLFAGFLVLKNPISLFKKYSTHLFLLTLIFLVLVFVPGLGHEAGGSTRWIKLPLFNFQPSEMLKITMIFFLSAFLIRQEEDIRKPWVGVGKTVIIFSIPALLLMLETDFGATVILAAITFGLVFSAGIYLKELIGLILILGSAGLLFISLNPVRSKRFFDFWATDLWSNNSDKVDQTKQALIGIARGEWTGTGIGAGIQKYVKLPEAHTDMIFAVIGEELGIFGMLGVLALYAFIIVKGFEISKVALQKGRKFSSYLANGICIWFAVQISVNVAMNIGLIPIKGWTLPLISYGGSSLIFAIIAIAILVRIDMENRASYEKQKHFV
jgi:cell division protein FtsW